MQVSSAYSLNSQSFTADFISFTYHKKSIGPKMDPWGTPQSKTPDSERLFSRLTVRFQFFKWDSNHLTVSGENPIYFSFFKRIWWSGVSKAFWRSMSIMLVDLLVSNPFNIWLDKCARQVFTECLLPKPDW